MFIPVKYQKHHIVKQMLLWLEKNVGKQCTAMSVCALLYHNMKGILSTLGDLKEVTHLGNPL